MPITVMIAFSNMLFSRGVQRLLDNDKEIVIKNPIPIEDSNFCETINSLKPEVVLVDFMTLHNIFGKNKKLDMKFILFDTLCGEENLVSAVLKNEIKGIISGNIPIDLLKKAIKTVARGDVWFDKGTVKNLINGVHTIRDSKISILSQKEREIISLVSNGHTNKEIASKLSISEPTVKGHLSHIFRKLNIKNRPQLIAFSHKNPNNISL